MSKINIDEVLGNIGDKYDVTDHVIGMQNSPGSMVSTNFKQEYTVIIRKKKYYAITSLEGNDAYLKMYQIDNFTSIATSTSVNGTSPGTCRLSLVGGQKVICAEREEQDSTGWGAGEKGFFNMLSGWSSETDDGTTAMDVNGNYLYNNMLFDNIQDMKKAKYGSKVAEKCDIEPMDEIYVFGKSKREKENGKYKIYQLFFGYISDVTKSFTSDKSNPLIQISAIDHLKLLQISYMANTPAVWYNVCVAGAHYDEDFAGNLIIDDDPLDTDKNDMELKASPFTNAFAGRYPYEIISKVAAQAGIPKKFLKKRIEKVKRIPFIPTLKQNMVEQFQTDVDSVLGYCNQAAEKLFMEFFADEEGQLVFKIPNWTLGVNKLSANNAYIDSLMPDDEKKSVEDGSYAEKEVTETVTTYETVTQTLSNSVTHTVASGDTLWDLAGSYLGDSNRWNEIYDANRDKISNPHWIYPGQVLTIKQGSSSTTQVPKQIQVTNKKKIEGATLSGVTDKYIPVIQDNEIISFVLTDSDSQVANCFEITQEAGEFGKSANGDGGKLLFNRVVQDWGSIIRFGMRKAKTVSTPVLDEVVGPVLFGTMMVQKALSQRYRGTLNMIEESSIRVGNPVRLFMYDEHPYKFNDNQLQDGGRAQAVFYVEQITRDMKPDGVSTMQLTLSAGRVMGMESIYDKMQLLYGRYYEEPKVETYTPPAKNTASGSGAVGLSGNITEKQAQILQFAQQFLGRPYVYGGKGPDVFDCSGFAAYVFNHFGYNLTSYTHAMENEGTVVSSSDMQACDLVFFNGSEHVGIYMGNGQMIHAPHKGDNVKISPMDGYYNEHLNKVVRVLT